MEKEDLIELLNKISKADKTAFSQLVHSYQNALSRYIQKTIDGCPPDCIQDISQNTWIEVWDKLISPTSKNKYDPAQGEFYTWLIKFNAHRKVHDWIRKNKTANREDPLHYSVENEDDEVAMPNDIVDISENRQPDKVFFVKNELDIRQHAFLELMRIIFLCGGYPHQQLSFVLSKQILGKETKADKNRIKEKKRQVEGSSIELDRLYGKKPLMELRRIYWNEYKERSEIPQVLIKEEESIFGPLDYRLGITVKKLMMLDKKSASACKHILSDIVGDTSISDYYAHHRNGFKAAIPDWCYKVSAKVCSAIGLDRFEIEKFMEMFQKANKQKIKIEPRGCNHCKLRHLEPCINMHQHQRFVARTKTERRKLAKAV